jgi:hypothetical protein
MTKNINTIIVDEEFNGDTEFYNVDWREIYTRRTWRFDRGNTGLAKQFLTSLADRLGVEVYVKEKNPVGVPVAHKGEVS